MKQPLNRFALLPRYTRLRRFARPRQIRSKPRPGESQNTQKFEEIIQETMDTESKEEVKPEMEATTVRPQEQVTSGITLSQNALQVLQKRYLKKDKAGKVIETPEEMFARVARTIASAELKYNPQADVKKSQVFV